MKRKIRVGVLFGGASCEHKVSCASAQNVLLALNSEKYEAVPIFIDKTGKWQAVGANYLIEKDPSKLLSDGIAPVSKGALEIREEVNREALDVIFPVLHGPNGEDGTVQGFLKLMQIPFVGPSVLGSSVSMDKDVMKRLLREANIPVVLWVTLQASQKHSIDYEKIRNTLGFPLFVKPANMGSSVGVSKVNTKEELVSAIETAFRFDRKILVEQAVKARELECAVLGNEVPKSSLVGEVITSYEFYSYEAKYLDEGLRLEIPAKIPEEKALEVQSLAIETYKVLCCEGMARVDFFMTSCGKLYVNELNAIPGFTNSSMYPKLWEKSGISLQALVDQLITLAITRHEQECEIHKSCQELI
jgi:D-alanine-D-alanine ligase